MEIVVINGSPKGENGVTIQYVAYLEKIFPRNKFQIFHVGKNIKKLEKDQAYFQETLKAINNAETVIWCFPVYVFLVPYQLKRFIEMIYEGGHGIVFSRKYSTAITTSAHFFDYTAHNYIHQVSSDFGMHYFEGLSASMNDLLLADKRDELKKFFVDFMQTVENKLFLEKKYDYIQPVKNVYAGAKISANKEEPAEKITDTGVLQGSNSATQAKKVVLLTDAGSADISLLNMIKTFKDCFPLEVEEINITGMGLKGGCRGCMNCAYDGRCIYNDGFQNIYSEKIIPAAAIIYALKIKDRFFSANFKLFMDRSFCNGHRPVTMGKQTGFIISGPLRQLPNLRQVIEAHAGVGQVNLAGVVTDEYTEDEEITALLKTFSQRLNLAIESQRAPSVSFLGKGGHLVFRDLIYNMSNYFRADHLFYQEQGLYDYPQKDLKARALNVSLGLAIKIPRVRRLIYRESIEGMIRPHRKVIKNAK